MKILKEPWAIEIIEIIESIDIEVDSFDIHSSDGISITEENFYDICTVFEDIDYIIDRSDDTCIITTKMNDKRGLFMEEFRVNQYRIHLFNNGD